MANDAPPLRLYNTLTRSKDVFTPIDPRNVRMYVCGPTVYDYAHIGNARPVIVFDVLFRLLRHLYGAEHVTYVRNITDVDDKINARAARDWPELPLNEGIRAVTEKTAAQFESDVAALGCLPPTVEPRATDNIEEMQRLIAELLANGHAYEANGEVLFDTASMPDYGRLSRRPLEENLAGARIAVDAHKKNPADFVLWKQSSAEEPGWESPWGCGRPGWHIECSAMSERYLGQTFDIHGGGLDLIFPHHENEIAQSRCAHGTDVMANFWMHNGFLQVEGQKMSKRFGNFVTINELLETEKFGGRKWPGEVLRLAMLMTHYRQPIDLSVGRLRLAEQMLEGWYADLIGHSPAPQSWFEYFDEHRSERLGPSKALVDALSDDINVHQGLLSMQSEWKQKSSQSAAQLASDLMFLGVDLDNFERKLSDAMGSSSDVVEIESDIEARLAALAARDFARADAIRAELLAQGIQLMDYKDPATGERRTKWEVKR